MRKSVTSRIYKVLTYQQTDRLPDVEFGYWPQTLRRWLKEGMPLKLTREETEKMFLKKVDLFFGFDTSKSEMPTKTHMNPAFTEEIIETRGSITVMRDTSGIIAERYRNNVDESSIPHFVEFPVKGPDDWNAIKSRYKLSDCTRSHNDRDIKKIRAAEAEGEMISMNFTGFYGQLRHWMGMENLSYAFYDYPSMIHDMVQHWAELCALQIESLPSDIPVDFVSWWEDMASKNGPLVSPDVFREFLQPGYHRVMEAAKKRGCVLSIVDCDGNPHDIVANWLEEGVNIMFPLEILAGVDPLEWRKEFGKDLLLRGGIKKYAVAEGGAAIDRELERIKPLIDQGGYIPHLDHLVPPDISYGNYCEYLEKKKKLIGR